MSKELDRISKNITSKERDINRKIIEFDIMYFEFVKDYPQYFFGPKTLKPGKSKKVKKQ